MRLVTANGALDSITSSFGALVYGLQASNSPEPMIYDTVEKVQNVTKALQDYALSDTESDMKTFSSMLDSILQQDVIHENISSLTRNMLTTFSEVYRQKVEHISEATTKLREMRHLMNALYIALNAISDDKKKIDAALQNKQSLSDIDLRPPESVSQRCRLRYHAST